MDYSTSKGVSMREAMIAAGLWPVDDPRDPSKEIGAAWEVVEKFRCGVGEEHAAAVIEMVVSDVCTVDDCYCKIYGPSIAEVEAIADQMPLAICRAALVAVEE